MKTLTLAKETLQAIRDRLDTCERDAEAEEVNGAEFRQDGCDIYVDGMVYARWVNDMEVHGEVPPPNTEDFSHYEPDGWSVDNVVAYDADGEEVEITNADEI